jgi:hypothetical protein
VFLSMFHVKHATNWGNVLVATGPMPPINLPGGLRVEMHFTYLNQQVENVYHLMNNLPNPGDVQLHLVANTFKNWWTTEMKSMVSTELTLREVVCRELTPDGVAVLETADLPQSGANNTQPMPGNVTVAVHWGTGRRGRSFNGRTYHLGLCANQVTGDQITPAALPVIQAAYDALRTALDNAVVGVEFSVLSVQSNKAWRVPPIMTPITGVAIDPNIDSQRRRLAGRGQ